MRKTKYIVKPTTQFKKDFKLAMKRSMKIELLEEVIAMLAMGETLPDKHKDHALTGNWVGHRECHILPYWLLIYRIEDEVLVLTLARTERIAIFSGNNICRRMEVILYDGFLMFSVRVRFVSFPLPEHPFQAARLPFSAFLPP